MFYILASTGEKIGVPPSVTALRLFIQNHSSIPISSQILLTETGHNYAEESEKDHNLYYVYDHRELNDGAEFEFISLPELDITFYPKQPPQITTTTTSDSLLTYFQSHLISHKIDLKVYSLSKERFVNQLNALKIARENLNHHYASHKSLTSGILPYVTNNIQKHTATLTTHDRDLLALSRLAHKGAPLSKGLPLETLKIWKSNCQQKLDNFVNDIETLQQNDTLIQAKADAELEATPSSNIDFKDATISELSALISELDKYSKLMSRDFGRVKSFISKATKDTSTTSPTESGFTTIKQEKMVAITELMEIHENQYVKEISNVISKIAEIHNRITKNQLVFRKHVVERLRSIADIESLIAKSIPIIQKCDSEAKKLNQGFAQLVHVHRIAPAYGAGLVEVLRRVEFERIFTEKSKLFAHMFAKFRKNEEKRRSSFKTEISRYIPQHTALGLEDDSTPLLEVSVVNAKNQTGLLEMGKKEITELETMANGIRQEMALEFEEVSLTANDSLAKLLGTLKSYSRQLDVVTADFNAILEKSGIITLTTSKHSSPSNSKNPSPSQLRKISSVNDDMRRDNATSTAELVKVYESRIKQLETHLRENYAGEEDLRSRITQLEEQSAKKEQELQGRITELEQQPRLTPSEMEEMAQNLSALDSSEPLSPNSVVDLCRTYTVAMRARVEELEDDLLKRDEEFEAANKRVKKLELELRSGISDREVGKKKVEEVEEKLGERDGEVSRLHALVKVLEVKKDTLEKEVNQLRDDTKNSQVEELEKKVLKDTIVDWQSRLEIVEKDRDSQVKKLQEILETQKLEVESLKSEIDETKRSHLGTLERLNENMSKIQVELATKTNENSNLVDVVSELKIRAQSTDGELERLRKIEEAYKENLAEVTRVTSAESSHRVRLLDFESQVGDLKGRISQLETQLKNERESNETKLDDLESKITILESNNSDLLKKDETSKHTMTQLQEKVERCDVVISDMKSEREKLEADYETNINQISSEKSMLESQVESSKTEIQALKDVLKKMQGDSNNDCDNMIDTKEQQPITTLPLISRSSSISSNGGVAIRRERSNSSSNIRFVEKESATQIFNLKNEIEDWDIVCKMALGHLGIKLHRNRRDRKSSEVDSNTESGDDDDDNELGSDMLPFIQEALLNHVPKDQQVGSNNNGCISISNFRVGDIVLFLPSRTKSGYTAFNIKYPNYYLDPSCIPDKKQSKFILGVLTSIQEQKGEKVGYYCKIVKYGSKSHMDLVTRSTSKKVISISEFSIGDLVLFLPSRNGQWYGAFNQQSPNFYLDPEYNGQDKGNGFIIGKIREIREFVWLKKSSSSPVDKHLVFGLKEGVKYWVCSV